MQNLKEKLTCGFKYDMRNLVNFHPTTQKSKNFTLVGYKNTEELSLMAPNSDAKMKNPDLVVSKMA